ncbi:hypothetical protein GCM10008904_17260 [Paraclostridium ghonii]|uniref:Membrane fusion protein n=1 Tax=Paraclostridium ghonii TaxID=29358 RepID=A0ABU0MVW2_9FIRM|nr:HlyD family efflux transporter periplasmic adaptor subunit [Paeniclostridium ghonii]MDQ0554981.1 putative membrane fusion protein [Paeniclostridium ghonii]
MKKLKINYTKIILLFICIYILSNILGGIIKKNTDTLVLENKVVKESFNKKGLIIRDEYLLESSMSGSVKYCVKEGSKIRKDDDVAYIYNDNIDEKTVNTLNELKKDISDIECGNTKIVKLDIKNINESIKKYSSNIQHNLLSKNINVESDLNKLSKLIDDKNEIIGSDLNSKTLDDKENEAKKVSNLIEDNSQLFKAKNSGVVSYKFDNNEKKLNVESIGDIKKSDIEDTKEEYIDIKKDKEVKKGEPVARVVNNLKQYVAISCNEKEVKKLNVGQKIILSSDVEKINANVYDIYKDKNDYIVILAISEQNVQIYDTRVKEFDIIYKSIEGLQVPKDALVEVDGKKGVYVISETGEEKFVELKGTFYESEEYIVIDCYKNRVNGIKTINIYDEVILNPKGKKISKSR